MRWELLLDDGKFEWWCNSSDIVWRRPVSAWNFIHPDGTPNNLRREGSLAWWRRAMGLEACHA